ncbi:MAG: hypothetical protein ACD_61C00120G0002 [uncultured bacterium]|nr:MAG: hypothetical protein ACD_61C00120G0002 [uncultured bacterium]
MEKYSYQNEAQEAEREKIKRDLAILEATEGFSLLTPRQRKIIRVSLLLQARAERDMDPYHKNDPWYYDWHKRSGYSPKYQGSLQHIIQWDCHGAIASLESGQPLGYEPPENPKAFYDAEYFELTNAYQVAQAIESVGFPCVVHVNEVLGNIDGEKTQWHSFLALGHDEHKNIVTWEKTGFNLPYRVARLNQVVDDYSVTTYYWGFRKLR